MNKRLVVGMVVSALLAVVIVPYRALATDQKTGSPLQWAVENVGSLWQHVNAIEHALKDWQQHGIPGPVGPQGPQGVAGGMVMPHMVVRPGDMIELSAGGANGQGLARCEAGEVLVGGGYQVTGGGVDILQSQIVSVSGQAYIVYASYPEGIYPRTVQVEAHCLAQ